MLTLNMGRIDMIKCVWGNNRALLRGESLVMAALF
jgi:hypothetical protein